MRTTTTLDDGIAQGLVAGSLSAAARPKVVSRPFGGGLLPGFDPDRMNQLNDELEAEAFLEKARRKTP